MRALFAATTAGFAAALVLRSWLRRTILLRRIPDSVELEGCGVVAVSTQSCGSNTLVTLDWSKVFGTLPFKIPFCSAVLTEDGTIYVSGSIGLAPPSSGGPPSIVPGGPKPEMLRTMQIVEACLKACGADVQDITMAHCYLVDNTKERFGEMNAAYLEFFGTRPLPARITVGCSALALGSCVEVDVIAKA